MGKPQKRYRGVRQRGCGSWVSQIRHPLSKNRIWLGKFETAEDAARAYDEAARLMLGSRASTNFPNNPSASQSSSSTLLSETVTSKLHSCNTASVQMTKSSISETQKESTSHAITASPQQPYRGSWVSEIRRPFSCNTESVQMTKSSISETQKESTSHAITASPQQPYRGSWVSEIRRPFLCNMASVQMTKSSISETQKESISHAITASPKQRYRGVRQRRCGSWVSEIRHRPFSKNKIWLGMFETAEDAARAYDEAVRLVFGSSTGTNFPYNPSASQSSSSTLLSETVTAKLLGYQTASLQMTKSSTNETQKAPTPHAITADSFSGNGNEMGSQLSDEDHC